MIRAVLSLDISQHAKYQRFTTYQLTLQEYILL